MADIDAHGAEVVAFMGKVKNLTRVAELVDSICDMAGSDAWHDYHTGSGEHRWLPAEYDYFLITCDVPFTDIARVLAYNRRGADLAEVMDRDADSERRRPIEVAAESYNGPGFEGLTERAGRLGWIGPTSVVRSPVPPRARLRATGTTMDEVARKGRRDRIDRARRKELDVAVRDLVAGLRDDVERLYVIDQLKTGRTKGRPVGSRIDPSAWQADVEKFGGDIAELAKHWGITQRQVRRRLADV